MPRCTGYTAAILDGKVTTATDFLKSCLHNFGVMVRYRDEPVSPEIPDSIPMDDYTERALDRSRKEHARRKNMNDAEWQTEYEQDRERIKNSRERTEREEREFAEKLTKIRCEIENWNCDEQYGNLKRFALEQLDISMPEIEYSKKYYQKRLDALDAMTLEEYKADRIRDVEESIEYYEKTLKEEVESNRKSNEFLSGFKTNLEKLGGK